MTISNEIFNEIVENTLNESTKRSDYNSDCFVTSEVAHNEILSKFAFENNEKYDFTYLGIGPCQNFTYIGLLKPNCSIILDARLDNHLGHLIFKLIFERAETPLQYLQILFSREMKTVSYHEDPSILISKFKECTISEEEYNKNKDWLLKEMKERWKINEYQKERIIRIYNEFFRRQLSITSVSEDTLKNIDKIPNYQEIIMSNSSQGFNLHFLTSNTRFQTVKKMQQKNKIIPIHGNYTSKSSLLKVNELINKLDLSAVGVVYLSNMEEFLLQRYVISNNTISSRPNPDGLFIKEHKMQYDHLIEFLQNIKTSEDCALIRFYFPGKYKGINHGIFPWLEGHITFLNNHLKRYQLGYKSIFESYL